jgi:hypothetical protein
MTLPYCIQEIQEQRDALPLPNAKFLADFLVALITFVPVALWFARKPAKRHRLGPSQTR